MAAARLEQTRNAVELWRHLVRKKASNEILELTKDFVTLCLQTEWGMETEIAFDDARQLVLCSMIDGTEVVI